MQKVEWSRAEIEAMEARIKELEIALGCAVGFIRGNAGSGAAGDEARRYADGLMKTALRSV